MAGGGIRTGRVGGLYSYACRRPYRRGVQLSQLSEEIDCCISGLSEQCRRVFLLSRTTGLKNREIAERLNISVKTVEKHIGAALSQLRLRLSRSGFLRLFL